MSESETQTDCLRPDLKPSTAYLHHRCRCGRCKSWRSGVAKLETVRLRERRTKMSPDDLERERLRLRKAQRKSRAKRIRETGRESDSNLIAGRTRLLATTYVREHLPDVWAQLREQATREIKG